MDDRGRAYDGVGGGVCMRARAVPLLRRARSMFPRAATHTTEAYYS